METVTDFTFLGSKITADGYFSHEIKRHLLFGRKSMTKLDSILKSRDITLPTNVRLVKAMIFPVVKESDTTEHWTELIKKREYQSRRNRDKKNSCECTCTITLICESYHYYVLYNQKVKWMYKEKSYLKLTELNRSNSI